MWITLPPKTTGLRAIFRLVTYSVGNTINTRGLRPSALPESESAQGADKMRPDNLLTQAGRKEAALARLWTGQHAFGHRDAFAD